MISIEKNTCPVEKFNVLSTKKFSIKISAKAFRALSSQIYSDLITAPIRELATNAWDAHVEANQKDKQFIVHLPNPLEPFFKIRDFGLGMSKERMETVYIEYFNSSKLFTNDQTGCHGLGSKSPLCYSDSFTVTSYWRENLNSKKGMKYVYAAFIENGEPTLAQLSEEVTIEPSGLEVEFSVKPDDFETFKNKAKSVYHMFKVKPIVVGVPDFELDQPTYSFVGKGWAIKEKSKDSYCEPSSVAIMGNIGYSLHRMGNMYSEFPDNHRDLISCGIEIEFEIGDLEIALSREDLQYDERTIKALNDKCASILKEIEVIVKRDIDNEKSFWGACCLNRDYLGFSFKYGSRFKNIIRHLDLEWNGKKLVEGMNTSCYSVYKFFWGRKRGGAYKCRKEKVSYVMCERNVEFFERTDETKKSDSRIKKYVEEHTDKVVYVLTLNNVDDRNKTISELGILESDLKQVDTLPVPPKKVRVKEESLAADTLFKFKYFDGYTNRSHWNPRLLDLKEEIKSHPIYYVKIKRFNPAADCMTVKKLGHIMDFMTKHCGFTSDVYGVSTRFSKIDKLHNCIDFIEFAKKEIIKFVKDENIEELIELSEIYNSFVDETNYSFRNILDKLLNNKDNSSETQKLIDKVLVCKNASVKCTTMKIDISPELKQFLNIGGNENKLDGEFKELIKDFYKKYPLVELTMHIGNIFHHPYMNEIVNYIKMIDKN